MAKSTSADGFYSVDKDILDRDEAAFVCAVVLDVLRANLTHVCLDALSDYDTEMPDEIKAVQASLTEIGAAQHGRDPGMGIDLDLADPAHARLLDLFAPWSINVDLLGPQQRNMGTFHDCAMWVHFRATPEQAAEIGARVTSVGPVVSRTVLDERRRQQGRARWAGRRNALRERARRLAGHAPRVGGPKGWPTITPPTVPPAGPPPFEPNNAEAPEKNDAAMSKRSKQPVTGRSQSPAKKPRYLWGPTGARLFDADGHEYAPHTANLPAKEVKRLVRRAQIPFAVRECGASLEWFDVLEVPALWDRIRPDFEDVDDWRPPDNAPGAQPYRAQLWQTITGLDQVLLLTNE